MIPKFAADILKAWRYAHEDVRVLDGLHTQKRADANALDIAMQTAGFTPSKVSEKNAEAFTMRNREAELSARRSGLVRSWVMAEINGDKDGQADIENQIKRWNSKHHDARISRPDLVRRSRIEARKAGKPIEPSRRYRKDVEAGFYNTEE
ncbi:hypothetical protein A9J41_08230 [Laribacter hongkongensis]|uniref:hypothetical protein n=1 Tax=Laribacter hongkongensis TaxID=168471 RepID=UPI0018781951|nr:hypothetical protein [Laribacter hongkongensis]MBE5530135.1 hypothetical protein [Laribacter hongkongensis]